MKKSLHCFTFAHAQICKMARRRQLIHKTTGRRQMTSQNEVLHLINGKLEADKMETVNHWRPEEMELKKAVARLKLMCDEDKALMHAEAVVNELWKKNRPLSKRELKKMLEVQQVHSNLLGNLIQSGGGLVAGNETQKEMIASMQ